MLPAWWGLPQPRHAPGPAASGAVAGGPGGSADAGRSAGSRGVGVSGSIDVSDKDVTVVVKLGMLAKAAGVDGDRLGKSIDKRLSSALT